MDIELDDRPGLERLRVTRLGLQTVAEHVLAAALYQATGHIGLRQAPGGLATPGFPSDAGERTVGIDGPRPRRPRRRRRATGGAHHRAGGRRAGRRGPRRSRRGLHAGHPPRPGRPARSSTPPTPPVWPTGTRSSTPPSRHLRTDCRRRDAAVARALRPGGPHRRGQLRRLTRRRRPPDPLPLRRTVDAARGGRRLLERAVRGQPHAGRHLARSTTRSRSSARGGRVSGAELRCARARRRRTAAPCADRRCRPRARRRWAPVRASTPPRAWPGADRRRSTS